MVSAAPHLSDYPPHVTQLITPSFREQSPQSAAGTHTLLPFLLSYQMLLLALLSFAGSSFYSWHWLTSCPSYLSTFPPLVILSSIKVLNIIYTSRTPNFVNLSQTLLWDFILKNQLPLLSTSTWDFVGHIPYLSSWSFCQASFALLSLISVGATQSFCLFRRQNFTFLLKLCLPTGPILTMFFKIACHCPLAHPTLLTCSILFP